MTTREINNIGEPIRSPNGTPLGGVKIRFCLATSNGTPSDALDVTSRERYLPTEIVVTTSATNTTDLKVGEFRVDLWPTSRSDRQVFYRCQVPGGRTFVAPLVESAAAIKWSDFASSGSSPAPAEVSAFARHLQDTTMHVSTEDRARWDAGGGGDATMEDRGVTGKHYQWVVSDGEAYLMEVAAGTTASSVMTDLDGSNRRYRWVIDGGTAALEEL